MKMLVPLFEVISVIAPSKAAIFSIVGIGNEFNIADRVLAGSNNGRSTQTALSGADPVDG